MQTFTVTFIAAAAGPLDPYEFFVCEADDAEHAREQAENAQPDCDVLWINLGEPS